LTVARESEKGIFFPGKKRLAALFVPVLFLVVSCTALPELKPVDRSLVSGFKKECGLPFPEGPYQLVHSIEAIMPGGRGASLIGITDLSPPLRTIHCVILSIEGLVLFDGISRKGEVSIRRGIRPFDSREFARGLMNDIGFVFFPPEGDLSDAGVLRNSSRVCRYRKDAITVVDVITDPDGNWEIRQYRNGSLSRSARALFNGLVPDGSEKTFPGMIELTVHKAPGYTLTLRLIRAEPLNPEPLNP